jgi:hypothetical protein
MADETSSRLLSAHAFEQQRVSGPLPAAYLSAVRDDVNEALFMFQFANGVFAVRKLSDEDEQLAPHFEAVDAEFGDVNGRADAVDASAAKGVFLARNLGSAQAPDKSPLVVNQLDVRAADNRLVFTEGTEDVFSRQGLKPSNAVPAVRERMNSDASKGMGQIVSRLGEQQPKQEKK